jgi:4-amino-4-deoxy-L-arabinose transferase-like glycosyltransferase
MPAARPAGKRQPIANLPGKQKVSRGAILAGLFLVLCAGYISYAATTGFDFAYDDFPQIVENPRIQSAHFLPQYFTTQVWAHLPGQPENLYRPAYLVWLLFNFSVFGASPAGWHFLNLLMNMLMTLLVYRLGRRLMPESPLSALIAAAVFALHPIHVEAVAWVSGGTECLMSLFFTGSFLCYLAYRRHNNGIWWLAASLLLFAAAVLTKETAIVLPGIVGCYELLLARGTAAEPQPRQRQLLSLAGAMSGYAVLAVLYFAVRAQALHGFAHRISDVPFSTSLLTSPWALYFYLSQLVVPLGLGPFYDVHYASGFSLQFLLLPLLVLSALVLGLWHWSRKSGTKLPLFLFSWLLLTLLPALAVFTIMSRYESVHDRYLYLPSVAFALLLGFAFSKILDGERQAARRKMFGAIAACLLVLLGIATYRQSLYWQNNLALFMRGVAVAPANVLAKLNLTSEMIRNQMLDGAFQVSQQALQLDPDSPATLAAAGQAAYLVQKYAMAEEYYSRALALAPPRVSELYYLGMARIKTGRFSEALPVLQKGNSLWPNSPGYHLAMGEALAGMGQLSAARGEYKLELALNPGSVEARSALAESQSKQ